MLRHIAIPCALTAALAAEVQAQPPGETAISAQASEAPSKPTGYRRQLMIADGLSTAVVGGAVAAGAWMFHPDDFHLPLMVGALGFSSYVVTAPVIHFAHRRVGRGFASGGARILGPAIVAATAVTVAGLEERDDGYGAVFGAGFAVGAVGAMVFDWYVLTPSDEVVSSGPTVAPAITASAEHVFIGVGGSL